VCAIVVSVLVKLSSGMKAGEGNRTTKLLITDH
jgi:hypothetical protein